MSLKSETIEHLKSIYFGGNWTNVNLKDTLSDVSWELATKRIKEFNDIATLTYHSTYFIQAIIDVLEEKPLSTKDKESFITPAIDCESDWKNLQENIWQKINYTIVLLEQSPENVLSAYFGNKKYGTVHSNIHGIIEHLHYHLGQIVVLKRILKNTSSNA